MAPPLNILIVEDSPGDVDLLVAELRRAGFAPTWKRVETEADFLAELSNRPDIILSDYSLPGFSGLRAADLVQASGLDIPFILISGTIGEDVAVEAMRRGATDYLLKDRLARLGSAVERALLEKQQQDKQREAADAQRRIGEQLRQSLQTQAVVLNALPAHIALLDPEGVIVAVNDAWRDFATANQLQVPEFGLGQNYLETCERAAGTAGAEALATATGIRRVLAGEAPNFSLEYACHSPTELRWFQMAVTPLRENQRGGAVAMHVNITERKRAEAALRETEERYRALFDRSHECVFLSDFEGNFLDANQASLELLGYRREDIPMLTYASLLTEDQLPLALQATDEIKKTGYQNHPTEYRLRCKDGRQVYVEIKSSLIYREGKPSAIQGIARDLTERRRAQELLFASEQRLNAFFTKAPAGLVLLDKQLRYVQLNETVANVNGVSMQDHLGKTVREVLPKLAPVVEPLLQKVLATGEQMLNVELAGETPSQPGVRRYWLESFFPIPGKDAGPEGIGVIFVEITESKQSEIKLQRANRDLQMLSRCNEALIQTANEGELLSTICQTVVEIGGYRMAWVGYAQDDDFRAIVPVARSGVDAGYFSEIKLSWDEKAPAGKGPAGQAIRSGRLAFSADTEQDADFYWQAAAQKRGYKGVICLPLRDAKRTFGLLGLYTAEILQPNEAEFKLLQELAEDLAFGIGHLRSETERKQAEGRVAEQAALLDRANDSIMLRDLHHRLLYCNQGAERLFGWSKEEVLGKSLRELLIVDQSAIDRAMQAVLQHSEWVGELVKKTKSNKPVTVDSRWTLVRDEAGQPKSILTIETNITERKRAEERMHLQSSVLTAVDNAILITDSNGTIEWVNPSFTRLTGYSAEETVGNKPGILKSGQHPPAFFANLWATITTGNAWQGELVNQRKDGKLYTEEMTITPVRGADGRIAHFVAIKQDVTERRSLEKQLRQAQKMEAIGTLAGGIAHDFNNILGAMFGFGFLLQQDTTGNPAAQESVEEILKAANRAKELVQQILTFSRQRETKRQAISLDPVVKEAMKFLRASLPAEIKIELSLASNAPTVLADPTQIYQVTINLATNALYAMQGRAGQLTVTLESFSPDEKHLAMHSEFRPIQYVRLAVADTGHGMDANTLEHLFEPFFTTKPVGQGTGLGLAVVHGIVKSHEGIITVESKVGQGTTFTLYFPAQTNETALTDTANHQLSQGLRQRILLLDDEPALTKSLRGLLERLNYQVTSSNHPREALELFTRDPMQFDLAITDLSMPEMNGIEVARQIQAVRPELPVILMSGFTATSNRENMAAAGIRELLEKPVSAAHLAEVLQRTFAQSPNPVPKSHPRCRGGANELQ